MRRNVRECGREGARALRTAGEVTQALHVALAAVGSDDVLHRSGFGIPMGPPDP